MNGSEKRSIVEFLAGRYRRARRGGKAAILNEACGRFRVGRRQARRF